MTRQASCSCGHLTAVVDGDPIRVSICHCLACQKRTGSAFGVQARFEEQKVTVEGRFTEYRRISDDGEERHMRFCPDCGGTVFFTVPLAPGMIMIPVGAFADPAFPTPVRAIYESRRHQWVTLADSIAVED